MNLTKKQKVGALLVAFLATLTLIANAASRSTTTAGGSRVTVGPEITQFAAPGGLPVGFTGRLDRTAVLQGGDGLVKMELVLTAADLPATGARIQPTDFLVILDRSGSMEGDKLERAKEAASELIGQMADGDRFSLVTYESSAQIAIPLAASASRSRAEWLGIVRGIRTGGGTNMSSGIDLALEIANGSRSLGRATRMILISDGHANEGDSSVEGLMARASRSARQEIVLSSVGVGEGFDEFLMSSIADAGTGNFYYLQHSEALAAIFASELSATQTTVASALAVTIDPEPGVRVIDAAGYPLETADGKTVFRPGSLFSGQERRIWLTLALPPEEIAVHNLGSFVASFRHGDRWHSLRFTETPQVACIEDEQEFFESVDPESWERAVVEEDYNRLQQKVASYVQAGRKDEALKEIDAYVTSNSELNQTLQRDAVKKQLDETRKLAEEVEGAFVGANQESKRNLLSKSKQASGWDGRRAGSKKQLPKGGNR